MPFPVAPRLPSSRAISTTVARAAGSSRLAPSTMSFISHTGSSRNPCRPTPRGRAQFLAPLAFPTTTSRSFASASKSIRDAEHPTGLWYHPLSSSSDVTRYAVSYLSQPPASSDSKDVIAVFEVPSPEASDPAVFARQHPDRVVANKAFWSTLHATLKDDVVAGEKDPILTQEADLREDGWAHLADQRQLLMPGRIPTPDSIIASVSFANCKISPDTYQPNDTHRPITKEEGWTVLRDEWLAALKLRLQR